VIERATVAPRSAAQESAVARRIAAIRNRAHLRDSEVADLLNTTAQTVSRWNRGTSTPQRDKLERLLDLLWIVERLSELYDSDEARMWLYSRHSQLNGERAVDRIQKGDIASVLEIVDQMHSGAFA
jgi:DNA-binding transcriptional regulator YiaG